MNKFHETDTQASKSLADEIREQIEMRAKKLVEISKENGGLEWLCEMSKDLSYLITKFK